jgi:hypothetical protein
MFKSLFVIIIFISSLINVQAQDDISGNWQLNSYGYNKGGAMNFSFISGVEYQFNEDGTGSLIDNGNTTNFSWKRKKKKLDITFTDKTYNYRIVQIDATDLILVDRNAGKDEDKEYEAYEKGLMFKKE